MAPTSARDLCSGVFWPITDARQAPWFPAPWGFTPHSGMRGLALFWFHLAINWMQSAFRTLQCFPHYLLHFPPNIYPDKHIYPVHSLGFTGIWQNWSGNLAKQDSDSICVQLVKKLSILFCFILNFRCWWGLLRKRFYDAQSEPWYSVPQIKWVLLMTRFLVMVFH